MLKVPDILCSHRLQQNLTLREVAERTKIQEKFLQAIENGHYHELPPLSVTRGFIKSYAEFLRLDPEPILAIFRREIEEKPMEVLPKNLAEPVKTPLLRPWQNLAFVFLISAIVIVLIAYLFWQFSNLAKSPFSPIKF